MESIEIFIIILNVVTLVLMGFDKHASRNKLWRIPEKLLLLLAIAGGSAGVWFGMKLFRHKTRHPRFMYGIPFIIALQVALLLFFSLR
ncbi:DUF1294 domain-containing protein [Dethiobacter alkaliphilus]|uniref:DUF1294 domain-containing protein n=1 Tax=Dethiobacter alkaliphilus AHT 1 TaxID=555088 RepID=C0GDI0_DETAL|nr:DUF1294 domain-containing protein [Dethiobacter alkaliphilus]EEG78701.1 protein of unknown function DUF1294 [Dethiobacter alkaliphilus AHT 1]